MLREAAGELGRLMAGGLAQASVPGLFQPPQFILGRVQGYARTGAQKEDEEAEHRLPHADAIAESGLPWQEQIGNTSAPILPSGMEGWLPDRVRREVHPSGPVSHVVGDDEP